MIFLVTGKKNMIALVQIKKSPAFWTTLKLYQQRRN